MALYGFNVERSPGTFVFEINGGKQLIESYGLTVISQDGNKWICQGSPSNAVKLMADKRVKSWEICSPTVKEIDIQRAYIGHE
jgi:hypothetical protein